MPRSTTISGHTGTSSARKPTAPTPAGRLLTDPSMPRRRSAVVEYVCPMNDNT